MLLIVFVLLPGITALLVLAGALTEVTGRGRRNGIHVLAYRWHAGHCLDGKLRTNSTWRQPASKVLHVKGRAHRWHWVRGWRRCAVRSSTSLLVLAIGYGLVTDALITAALVAGGLTLLAAWACLRLARWARTWPHRSQYERPLERTLSARLGIPATSLKVERDGGRVKSVAIQWAPEAELTGDDQAMVLSAISARLPIEAPSAAWQTKGRARSLVLTQSEPPPSDVSWDDVATAVEKAGPSDLVFGLGKLAAVSKASFSGDSPHLAISGGSGAGKSNLAAFLLLQELHRGSLIFNLDPKWISHLWLQGLPNVISAHDTPSLHLALTWLGGELLRRNKAAYYSAGGTGRVRASVGPRVIALCEELNYGMQDLKDYWHELRAKEDPKRSPALKGLAALSYAGRGADMHMLMLAQMLTAQSTGVSDSSVRTNAGIKCMGRYDPPNWNMVVGRHIPMPPLPTAPGRIQLVTARGVQETQVPWLHLDDKDEQVAEEAVRWAREYAVSGTVAAIPTGPEGIPPQLWPAGVVGQAHLAVSAGHGPETASYGTPLPPQPMTLREACDQGILRMSIGAARKASQRSGFPPPMGWDGPAALYDPSELQAFTDGKVRILR
jgi:hypothetical protein